jgi:hypothetical protein
LIFICYHKYCLPWSNLWKYILYLLLSICYHKYNFPFFHSSYKNYYSLILDRPKYLYLRMEGVKIKMHPITILIHMSMRDRWLFMCSLGVNHISLCIKTNWRHEYFCLPVASPSFVFPSTHIGVGVSMSCLLPVPPAAVPPAACRGAAAKTLVSTQLLWQLCFYK